MDIVEPRSLVKKFIPALVDSVVGNNPTSGLLTQLSPLLRARYSFETFDSHLGWISGLTWKNDSNGIDNDETNQASEADVPLKFLDMFIQDLTEFYSHSDDVESYLQQRHQSDHFQKLDNETILAKVVLDLGHNHAGEDNTVKAAMILTWNTEEKSWLLHDIYEEVISDTEKNSSNNDDLVWSSSFEEAEKVFSEYGNSEFRSEQQGYTDDEDDEDDNDNGYWDQYDDVGSDDDDNSNKAGEKVKSQDHTNNGNLMEPTSELSDDDDYYNQYDQVETEVTDKSNDVVGLVDEQQNADPQIDNEILAHISQSMSLLGELAKKKGISQEILKKLMKKNIESVYE